jgi:hypothetical protein
LEFRKNLQEQQRQNENQKKKDILKKSIRKSGGDSGDTSEDDDGIGTYGSTIIQIPTQKILAYEGLLDNLVCNFPLEVELPKLGTFSGFLGKPCKRPVEFNV